MSYHALHHAVFPPDWCSRMIARALAEGFVPASVDHYGTQQKMTAVRNNDRAAFSDGSLALEIEAALRHADPGLLSAALPERTFARIGRDFRMYKYVPGQYFKPHRDGDVTVDSACSLVTVLIYLNDAQGGETIIMPEGYRGRSSWVSISPKAGDVLLFSHDLWHEGRPVLAGEKFVLRTDLFYEGETGEA